MRAKLSTSLLFTLLLLVSRTSAFGSPAGKCKTEIFEGSVEAGSAYRAAIGGGSTGLKLELEPVSSGWRLRIVPASGAPAAGATALSPDYATDYAQIATPPYQSPSPLLLSTDFQFRAQDVLAWNPRHFQYTADAASYRRLARVYAILLSVHSDRAARSLAAVQLAELASQALAGEIEILDARLIPGIANQTAAAAAVSTHLFQTAHITEQSAAGSPSPLGAVTWLKFRIRLDLPAGFPIAGAGGRLTAQPCL